MIPGSAVQFTGCRQWLVPGELHVHTFLFPHTVQYQGQQDARATQNATIRVA